MESESTRQTGKHMHMSKSYFGGAPKTSCTLPKTETDKTLKSMQSARERWADLLRYHLQNISSTSQPANN